MRDLNTVYRDTPALHAGDASPAGFAWVVGDDQDNSVIVFLRRHGDREVLVVCNFTPVPRVDYGIGVPRAGRWTELLNTDAQAYGGGNMGNLGGVATTPRPMHGYPQSVAMVLPPLSTLILAPENGSLP